MSEIDNYLDQLDPLQRKELEQIRQTVKTLVPEAQEVITYGMPGLKYKGKYLFAYGGFKDHMSVFPGADPVASTQEKLKGYKISKGTIQFTLNMPLPKEIIKELVETRLKAINAK